MNTQKPATAPAAPAVQATAQTAEQEKRNKRIANKVKKITETVQERMKGKQSYISKLLDIAERTSAGSIENRKIYGETEVKGSPEEIKEVEDTFYRDIKKLKDLINKEFPHLIG